MAKRQKPNLIEYITKKKISTQAILAKKLGVSRAQISKWKSGERIPHDRTAQLQKIAGLVECVSEDWSMFVKTEQNAAAWSNFLLELIEDLEWGDSLRDLSKDSPEIYLGHLLDELLDLGANISSTAPKSIWASEKDKDGCMISLAGCLRCFFESWGQIYDWIDVNLEFDDLSDKAEYELFDIIEDLRWISSGLAIGEIDEQLLTAIGCDSDLIKSHVENSRKSIAIHLASVCDIRSKHGLPITEDYFKLITTPSLILAESSWSHSRFDSNRPGEAIKKFLPYGDRILLEHQECQAVMLNQIDEKLDLLLKTENSK